MSEVVAIEIKKINLVIVGTDRSPYQNLNDFLTNLEKLISKFTNQKRILL